tara:strand:- start:232992 stop:234764 length:1773 start_codon:yes stop_codon:yes gene_type:complete
MNVLPFSADAKASAMCFPLGGLVVVLLVIAGCGDDADLVREIQNRRQEQSRSKNVQDHLGETFQLLSDFVDLNRESATQQITYHLNKWRQDAPGNDDKSGSADAPEILSTISDLLPVEKSSVFVLQPNFSKSDVNHLRDSYLYRQVVRWVDQEGKDDPVLSDWFDSVESDLGEDDAGKLRTASRLFDWMVRNVALEPSQQGADFPSPPQFALGMTFQGPGYRQTDYETLWRGTGDWLQRAGVFTQLCRQADIPAAVLAVQSAESGELNPWAVGVRIGQEVYLFETELGTYIPGPGQVGIATLDQARKDASVMRRLNVPGFFDYRFSKDDVQQNIALLNALPVSLSPRMKRLQAGLTGQRRMRVYVDADDQTKQWDDQSGVAGVRLWQVPLLAELYRAQLQVAAERDPRVGFWYHSRWAMLDAEFPSAKQLAQGRWEHLHGRFADDDIEDEKGARTYYLTQRAPEFEIDDLRIDVDLQKAYGIRRELRSDRETYDRQVQQVQGLLRLGKRTATYWLSLVQYDDGRYDTAMSWLDDRVLDESQQSFWEPAARYNLARTAEKLGDVDRAVELYKTEGVPQEHGNRIRARLISR